MFKVGDRVKIINKGRIYSNYFEFANKYGYPDAVVDLHNDRGQKSLPNGTEGSILAMGKHLGWDEGILYILQCYDKNNTRIVINGTGLQFISRNINRRLN
jgi:hypothetical protein